ncbi:Uncharacterised protein [Amycolatopsis camponoti]|uniref:Uncharacterized protein n=1 Tax=Amycolatopsis camponoti TaxID=2606593 RepID=A0A6I8M4T9_9PSEU|nr:Uncharacterised protein [Amycolatopsis camponoti]
MGGRTPALAGPSRGRRHGQRLPGRRGHRCARVPAIAKETI